MTFHDLQKFKSINPYVYFYKAKTIMLENETDWRNRNQNHFLLKINGTFIKKCAKNLDM